MEPDMIRKTAFPRPFCAALLAAIVLTGASAGAQSKPEITVNGITQPSQRVNNYGFGTMGLIDKVCVKNGDRVKPGDLLISQDIRREENKLQQLKNEATSTARVDAAVADLDLKKKSLARIEDLFKKNASNPFELEEAQGKVNFADATLKVTELENVKNKLEVEGQKVLLDQMKIVSRVKGIIEDVKVSEGEVYDPQKPCIAVVVNDPMWVEVHLPTVQSAKLKLGDALDVRYLDEKDWAPGKVIYKAPVADAASDTQLVRLEVPYPKLRDTGLQVLVNLPYNIAGEGAVPAAAAAALPAPQP
jgi:multidrug efflux pump subunit AcrA (membrane-fusion protein)